MVNILEELGDKTGGHAEREPGEAQSAAALIARPSASYAEIVAALEAMPGVQLSALSQLGLEALRAGFEEIAGGPLRDILHAAVSEAVEELVSGTVADAVATAAAIPFAGAILGWVAMVAGKVIESFDDAADRAEYARNCLQRERSRRPIGTGSGGAVMPCDVLAPYLVEHPNHAAPWIEWSGLKNYIPACPSLGHAMWMRGCGMSIAGERLLRGVEPSWERQLDQSAELKAKQYARLARFARRQMSARDLGPRHAAQFIDLATRIGATRNKRGTDGGVSLWPLLMDLLLQERESGAVPDQFTWHLHAYYRTFARPHRVERVEPPECGFQESREAVGRLLDNWSKTIRPVYGQDVKELGELRGRVNREMRLRVRGKLQGAAPSLRLASEALRASVRRGVPEVRGAYEGIEMGRDATDDEQDAAPDLDAAPHVGALWVTDEEEATYAEVKRRWDRLVAWQVGDRIPEHRPDLANWREFSARWDGGDEDTERLGEFVSTLNVVERRAREVGFTSDGLPVPRADPEKAHPILNAIEQAARAAERAGIPLPSANAPARAAEIIRDGAAAAADAIGPTAKIAVGAAAAGGVLYGLHALQRAARARRQAKRRGG